MALLGCAPSAAMGLTIDSVAACIAPPAPAEPQTPSPSAANQRIPDSQAVAGSNHIAWVWLGSPTLRYPHGALGGKQHAGSIHAMVKGRDMEWTTVSIELPLNRVFEDRVPRLVDLDGDGLDEIVVIEADARLGAAIVVLGVDRGELRNGPAQLVQRAIGPRAGSTFRWMNPVGWSDFDGDGRLDLASVTTPHIGGTLTLHHYRPPHLVPFAKASDVSNHRMGALEQRLAVVMAQKDQRPTTVLPDMTLRALVALRWEAPGQWKELANNEPLPDRLEQLTLRADGSACALLANGQKLRVTLTP
ncbi:MAG: VCBS repeat-containing protein [Hydrogenophaga sp.]